MSNLVCMPTADISKDLNVFKKLAVYLKVSATPAHSTSICSQCTVLLSFFTLDRRVKISLIFRSFLQVSDLEMYFLKVLSKSTNAHAKLVSINVAKNL